MTPTLVQSTPVTLGASLAPVHARWLEEVRRNVAPATHPEAGFWPRWAAIRYLADRFAFDFGLEGELLDGVIGWLDAEVASRLVNDREALQTLWGDLDRMGRRRGTGVATAAIAGSFLQTLGRWFAGLEQAVAAVPVGELPPDAATLLARLRQAHGVGGQVQAGTPDVRPATASPAVDRA